MLRLNTGASSCTSAKICYSRNSSVQKWLCLDATVYGFYINFNLLVIYFLKINLMNTRFWGNSEFYFTVENLEHNLWHRAWYYFTPGFGCQLSHWPYHLKLDNFFWVSFSLSVKYGKTYLFARQMRGTVYMKSSLPQSIINVSCLFSSFNIAH